MIASRGGSGFALSSFLESNSENALDHLLDPSHIVPGEQLDKGKAASSG